MQLLKYASCETLGKHARKVSRWKVSFEFEIKTQVNLMFDVFLQLCKVCKANKFRFQKLQNGSSTHIQSYPLIPVKWRIAIVSNK